MELKISDLCPTDAGSCTPETCGQKFVGLTPSDVVLDQGEVWETPWSSTTTTVTLDSAGPNTTFTLRLHITDTADAIFDTGILIDRIRFTPSGD